MFDHLQRELRRLEGTSQVSVPIESDVEGYLDKECPAEACLFGFKVHGDDWREKVRDEEVFCPSCRHAAPAKSWYTRDQIARAREYALATVKRNIGLAMRSDAAAWNRRQPSNSFISMTMDVKGSAHPAPLPLAATEPMRLQTICEQCQCRYSFVGAAYFCPCCGANSAEHTFKQTLANIRTAVGTTQTLRATFGRDEAEVLIRTVLEKGMQDTVTSFQRAAERAYERLPGASTARRNIFQNLEAGSALWRAATGTAFGDLLDPTELASVSTYFQQRHLLAHQQGVVDQEYLSRSGDQTYTLGQRIVVREESVLGFAGLVEKLGNALLGQSPAPAIP